MSPETDPIAQFFDYEHLPENLKEVSRPFGQLAAKVMELPKNPERSVALRKLLEAKDAAVRAKLAKWALVLGVLASLFVLAPSKAMADTSVAPTVAAVVVDAGVNGGPTVSATATASAPSTEAPGFMTALVATIFATLLPILKKVFDLLRTTVAGTTFSGAIDVVETYVESAVAKLKGHIDDALADDGKISPAELAGIIDALKKELPASVLTVLTAHLGDGVETYLVGLVQGAITKRQQALADAAGAAAAAQISNLDQALAARRARVAPVTP